jgi:hypothetical protein
MQEKFKQKKRKLFHVLVELKGAFDRIPRGVIELALRSREYQKD